MTEPSLIERQRSALHELFELAGARDRAEREAESGLQSRQEAVETAREEASRKLATESQAAIEAAEREFQKVGAAIAARFASERDATQREYEETKQRTVAERNAEQEKTEAEHQEARWTASTVFEAAKAAADTQLQETRRKVTAFQQTIDGIRQDAARALGPWLDKEDTAAAGKPFRAAGAGEELLDRVKDRIAAADDHLWRARDLEVLKYLKGPRFVGIFLLVWLVAMAPAALSARWYFWIAGATAGTVFLALVTRAWLRASARKEVRRLYRSVCRALAEAEAVCKRYEAPARVSHGEAMARSKEQRDASLQQVDKKYEGRRADLVRRRDTVLRQIDEQYRRRMAEITRRRDVDAAQSNEKYPPLLAGLREQYESDRLRLDQDHQRQLQDLKTWHAAERDGLARRWRQGLAKVQATWTEVGKEVERLLPGWGSPVWQDWQPPASFPPVLRFGEFHVAMDQVPGGLPRDERLRAATPAGFTLPALLPFPGQCSLLFKAGETGRARAEQALQMVLLRLLSAIPPAKARFTIIDPVGLGQNFAAFMHLADYEEALVASRIWTEAAHIEQRLADLTAHMENVIQKCLRNQFETIEEYNAQAGEVAEPFRFLVVANFPANFTPEAARRLVSVVASGVRCGVHTLITVDTQLPLPQGFNLKDLEQSGVTFLWKEGRFLWRDADFGKFPFQLDAPPDSEFATRLLHVVGKKAKEASRVEVPFSFIAAPPEQWWTEDSRSGIRVPLGRAGATKRQYLSLGKGTAQHVLIAGKTGSGKSTLLHAIITDVALLYSPDQVELYLVDFKEGVEFKAYATHELPHARLVAIESEREFGLSVLQRLEAELKVRGDRFRALGVQDLSGFRQAAPDTPLPRMLLIVDEFQLFFIEDDKIAQESALVLDRLVRQGRAFGIHVLLGSQTLGGAYSLARSTIGQMAVRIALQCSESDAHLILSDGNPAARLLTRPGEAIYNDANGLIEGNDFFQVVWLSDELREDYLDRVRELARERGYTPPQPQIVFEGKAPADVNKNHLLNQLLLAADWPEGVRASQGWLGEALAIKDATAATFRAQSGSNLLIIGQAEESALGALTTALVSLAAQQSPAAAKFYALDGSPVDAPHAGLFGRLADVLPHPLSVGGWRELPAVVAEVAAEVDRRQKGQEGPAPALFLFVYGLQRFRDLRKAEDDFGFSRRGEARPPNPAQLFSTILREGPAVNVYTLIWCDTLNNVNRALDRQGLREFEMRVLFQMSAADSSNLIDTPLASKLGLHRALFYSEDRGQPEKFRPYGLPSEAWLAWVKEQFVKKQAVAQAGSAG